MSELHPASAALPQAPPTGVGSADAGTIDLLRAARSVIGAFDALVRSVHHQASGVDAIAARIADQWLDAREVAFECDATAWTMLRKVLLRAGSDEGRWVLPAYMAGVRNLAATDDVCAEDLLALAQELARLGSAESMVRFNQWVWSDGVEGLEIETDASFSEVLENTVDDLQAARDSLAAQRAEVAEQRAFITECKPESVLLIPLVDLTAAAKDHAFELTREDTERLKKQCDDPTFWATERLSLVLSQGEMQELLPPKTIARQLMRIAARTFDQRFLGIVAGLDRMAGAYPRSVLAALERQPVGEAIARHAQLDHAGVARLQQLIQGQSERISCGIVRGLCERAGREGDGNDAAIAALGLAIRPDVFLKKADFATLEQPARMALGRILVRIPGGPEMIGDLVGNLKPPDAVKLVQAVPVSTIPFLARPIRKLLSVASPRERTVVAQALVDNGSVGCIGLCGEALHSSHAQGWELRCVRTVCRAMLSRHVDTAGVLAMVHEPMMSVEARVVVLDELAHSHAAPDALRWRFGELFDPPPIREKLAELRAQGLGS